MTDEDTDRSGTAMDVDREIGQIVRQVDEIVASRSAPSAVPRDARGAGPRGARDQGQRAAHGQRSLRSRSAQAIGALQAHDADAALDVIIGDAQHQRGAALDLAR